MEQDEVAVVVRAVIAVNYKWRIVNKCGDEDVVVVNVTAVCLRHVYHRARTLYRRVQEVYLNSFIN